MDIFHKLFDHLYSMQLRYKKIQEQMSPCLKYLSQQMKFFQHTLYVDCLREVTIAIWKTVIDVRMFRLEVVETFMIICRSLREFLLGRGEGQFSLYP